MLVGRPRDLVLTEWPRLSLPDEVTAAIPLTVKRSVLFFQITYVLTNQC